MKQNRRHEYMMTFDELCQHDAHLRALLQEVTKERYRKDSNFCANELWYALPRTRGFVGIKFLMQQLVGHGARRVELRTQDAYDVAYHTLYNAMPNCAHEGSCRHDYDAPPPAPTERGWESMERKMGPVGFSSLVARLRAAAGGGK
jgi:hypothetical protein